MSVLEKQQCRIMRVEREVMLIMKSSEVTFPSFASSSDIPFQSTFLSSTFTSRPHSHCRVEDEFEGNSRPARVLR